jgi:hypothetical protein
VGALRNLAGLADTAVQAMQSKGPQSRHTFVTQGLKLTGVMRHGISGAKLAMRGELQAEAMFASTPSQPLCGQKLFLCKWCFEIDP